MIFIQVDHHIYPQMWVCAKAIHTMHVIPEATPMTHIRLADGSVVVTPNSPTEILERISEVQSADNPITYTLYTGGTGETEI